MFIIGNIPTLAILFVIYNLIVFVGDATWLTQILLDVQMMSGAQLQIRGNDVLVLAGLGLLSIEIFKSTRTSVASMMEQALSLLLFILFLIEFLMVKAAGTSTFLILTTLQLVDVIAGFTVSVSTARRDINFEH